MEVNRCKVQKLNQRYPLWQRKTHRILTRRILSKLKRKKNTHLLIILKCSWFSSEWGTSRLLLRKVSLRTTRLIFVFLQTISSTYIFPIVAWWPIDLFLSLTDFLSLFIVQDCTYFNRADILR